MSRWISLLCGLFLVTSLQASPANKDLQTRLFAIHTLQADFIQTVKESNKVLQQAYGHMALERPGKFRWEITKPVSQTIVANGSRLWLYDPDLEQVTIRSFSQGQGNTPALLLSDANLNLAKEFVIETENSLNSDYKVTFLLTPKGKNNSFSLISLTFNGNTIEKMQFKDRLGHTTIIDFQHVKTGGELPASLFALTTPPGVDVIDETHH